MEMLADPDTTRLTERMIGDIRGKNPGPAIIFMGGVHGNEPAGLQALQQVCSQLDPASMNGNLYALAGNLTALKKNERYIEQDLNRLWTDDRIKALENGRFEPSTADEKEQAEIYDCVKEILENESGPFYFMDLHTTSGPSQCFMTVNDSLLNRKFTSQYPVPIVLGIEEYLEGPILSYINELGYVSFGFEGGQHNDPVAVKRHESFILLSLHFTGILILSEEDYQKHFRCLNVSAFSEPEFYEIIYRYRISEQENFQMKPGFSNFQKVGKGEVIALSNGDPIKTEKDQYIFMPLYQSQGTDGFFSIRRIPAFVLRFSAWLRKIHSDRLVAMLPGISWKDRNHQALMVNLRVARFFTRQFFHLLGYRSRRVDRDHLIMKNREAASRDREYQGSPWY